MELQEVLKFLEYDRSPNFLAADQLVANADNAHIYRKAQQECGLYGAYTLRGSIFDKAQADVPLVYVCHAATEQNADLIHRRVWNQNIVPFVLVISPRNVRLYSGFNYGRPAVQGLRNQDAGILHVVTNFNELASLLGALRAESVDSGNLWKELGSLVTPEARVDWKLLENLRDLDDWLVKDGIENRSLSHAIIGKFVYLRYLKDRQILSDRKLAEWRLEVDQVFSRHASLDAFCTLLERLDEWLNGAVFPISANRIRQIGVHRLRQVAAIFQGDSAYGQLHLDFAAFDFSFIPIETLSVIYEQFLHAAEHETGKSAGRLRGAYYTPVPLVNFMLDQLETRRPLRLGMRVLDPACGSGVFLVQCYRKLIEQQVRKNRGNAPKPVELRELLTDHVFGIDSDSDACQIAELSLILTLLDYVKPPDLTNTRFKLPVLQGKNIFHGNAFDGSSNGESNLRKKPFDWVVGNPPWIELSSKDPDSVDRPVIEWIQRNKSVRPTGGNQVAEAFAWHACEFVAPDGVVGLLVPAMTLFKYESKAFRKAFFERNDVWAVANFSNLAEVLFAGRSRVPAAALFYSHRCGDMDRAYPASVEVYSPLVANQVLHDPRRSGRRLDIWSIIINASEVRDVAYRDIISGEALPWKLATWGAPFDMRLLSSVKRRFPTIGDLEDRGVLTVSQGLELRTKGHKKPIEHLEQHSELAGKQMLDVAPLKRRRNLFRLPQEAIVRVPMNKTYVRKGRFALPFGVCRSPHVLVGASRNFSVYHDNFLIVPPRQIGIASEAQYTGFLKALALYLNSDFVTYHQFLMSPQLGVQRLRATLQALRSLPIPFAPDDTATLAKWEKLYRETQSLPVVDGFVLGTSSDELFQAQATAILRDLNELTYQALKLDTRQRATVRDLVHVRLSLIDGKVGDAAIRFPERGELKVYAQVLQSELDDFVGDSSAARHQVQICFDERSGMIEIELLKKTLSPQPIAIFEAGTEAAGEFQKARDFLLQEHSQWVYFNRNLRIYEGAKVYLFKPMRRLHWAESQAIADAAEVIAETMQADDAPLEEVNG